MASTTTRRRDLPSGDAEPSVDAAVLDGTAFSGLPKAVAQRLVQNAHVVEVEAGSPIFRSDDDQTNLGVLLEGLVRSYLTAADGRQLTIRYSRPGSLTSRRAGLSGEHPPVGIQAVTACRILELDSQDLLDLARTSPELAFALVDELSVRLLDVYATVADTAFGSMRQRVARHLLALGELNRRQTGRRTAHITQQQLADGIGCSREGVARMLGVLRDEGLIRTAPREIELLDVRRLESFLGEWRTDHHRLEPDLSFEAERLLEASPNAVVAVDRDGVIVFANSSVGRVFGCVAADVIGRPVEILVPERLRHQHADHRYRFLEAPRARPMGLGLELRGRRFDGTEFPMAASLTTIETRDGALVIATVVELEAPLP